MILSFGSSGSSLLIFLLDLGSLPSSIKHLLAEAIFLAGVMYGIVHMLVLLICHVGPLKKI